MASAAITYGSSSDSSVDDVVDVHSLCVDLLLSDEIKLLETIDSLNTTRTLTALSNLIAYKTKTITYDKNDMLTLDSFGKKCRSEAKKLAKEDLQVIEPIPQVVRREIDTAIQLGEKFDVKRVDSMLTVVTGKQFVNLICKHYVTAGGLSPCSYGDENCLSCCEAAAEKIAGEFGTRSIFCIESVWAENRRLKNSACRIAAEERSVMESLAAGGGLDKLIDLVTLDLIVGRSMRLKLTRKRSETISFAVVVKHRMNVLAAGEDDNNHNNNDNSEDVIELSD